MYLHSPITMNTTKILYREEISPTGEGYFWVNTVDAKSEEMIVIPRTPMSADAIERMTRQLRITRTDAKNLMQSGGERFEQPPVDLDLVLQ